MFECNVENLVNIFIFKCRYLKIHFTFCSIDSATVWINLNCIYKYSALYNEGQKCYIY